MTSPESRATSVPDVATPDVAGRPHRGRRRALAVAGGVALTTMLASCAKDAPQDIFQPEGEGADKINKLQVPVFIAAGVVGVLVAIAVVVVIVRFRSRGDDDTRVVKQLHGKTWAEIGWTIAPALVLLCVAVPTVATVISMADKPDDALQIDVVGQQWWWEFTYPDTGVVTSGELVIPVDTDVELNITSRDVIHSFWFPALNGKRDAVPNRVHQLTLHGTKVGEYYGQCTEFCGLSHANMRMRAVVLSQADYATWQANQQTDAAVPAEGTTAAAGYTAFGARCASCHSVGGQPIQPGNVPLVPGVAPNLTHLMSRTTFAGASFDLKLPDCDTAPEGVTGTNPQCLNRTDLSAWLRNPSAMKPMRPGEQRGMPTLGLTETEISDIVDYLSTLK